MVPIHSPLLHILIDSPFSRQSAAARRSPMDFKGLDSPLDPLAFNYVSFGFFTVVHNLWTWVAVLTAAVSFWRIRIRAVPSAAAMSPPKSDPPLLRDRETETSTALLTLREDPAGSTDAGGGVRTKGKFIVYYENDGGSDGEEEVAEPWGDAAGGWSEWWEGVVKRRMGELEWYSGQDRRVLNGNVVRLWEGSGRSAVPSQAEARWSAA